MQTGTLCARCGDVLDGRVTGASPDVAGICRACRLAPPPFARAVAYGVYQGRLKDVIHALKYDRIRGASRQMGQLLAAAIESLAGEAPAEMLVVPVPLHKSKNADRGFNQARLLAAEAIRFLRRSRPGWRLRLAPKTLMRLRATESQAGLTACARRRNLRGAFRVGDPGAVAGRDVLVVDDIFTTGATARAVTGTLLSAGAKSVWVATLARTRRIEPIQGGVAGCERDAAADSPGERWGGDLQPASMYSQDHPSF